MKKQIIFLTVSVLFFSCSKKEIINQPTNSKQERTTRSFGGGFMGIYYDQYQNLGYQNYITPINTTTGALTPIQLYDFNTTISYLYYNFKCTGLSYIPMMTFRGGTRTNPTSLNTDLVAITNTQINNSTNYTSRLIFINSQTGQFAYGPTISNGFHFCEYDFLNNKLLSINEITGAICSIDLSTGLNTMVNNTHSQMINYGAQCGFYIYLSYNTNINTSTLGYVYRYPNYLTNPQTQVPFEYLGEESILNTAAGINFYNNGNTWVNPHYPYISTVAGYATTTTTENFRIANYRKSIDLYNDNAYVSYSYQINDGSIVSKLGKFDKNNGLATTNAGIIYSIFTNSHVLEDMTHH